MSDEEFLSHSTECNKCGAKPYCCGIKQKKRHENISMHLREVSHEIVIKDARCHEMSEGYEFSTANSMASDIKSWKKEKVVSKSAIF